MVKIRCSKLGYQITVELEDNKQYRKAYSIIYSGLR
jgi:hypothetical protein